MLNCQAGISYPDICCVRCSTCKHMGLWTGGEYLGSSCQHTARLSRQAHKHTAQTLWRQVVQVRLW